MNLKSKPSQKLPFVVALDTDWKSCKIWVERLSSEVWGFKVGSALYTEKGPKIIEKILNYNAKVFLDLKFHDIPNTVQQSVRNAFKLGASLVTVHGSGGEIMLKAAAAEQSNKKFVLSVSVLTSMSDEDLTSVGISRPVADQFDILAHLAMSSGIRGLVCSAAEVGSLRKKFPKAFLLVPGLRLNGSVHDQKRVGTPQEIFRHGADLAVLGRALTEADDWKQAWKKIKSSLDAMYS